MPGFITLARLLLGAAAFGAVAVAGASAQTTPATAAPSHLAVLPVRGPLHVATLSREIADPSRRGSTMVQLFYPTAATHGWPAPYMPKQTADLTAKALHEPPQLVESISTGALADAPPAGGKHPVILFSPGLTELRSDATALVTDLASRGYIVVTIDHPTESAIVEFPNGRIVAGSFHDSSVPAASDHLRALAVARRIGDLGAVVNALPRIDAEGLLRGRLDLARIGMFGFSLGGAATASAMRALPQIRAGVDLDGTLYGSALTTPLNRPFLFIARDGHTNATDASWAGDWSQLHGYRRQVHLVGSGHGPDAPRGRSGFAGLGLSFGAGKSCAEAKGNCFGLLACFEQPDL